MMMAIVWQTTLILYVGMAVVGIGSAFVGWSYGWRRGIEWQKRQTPMVTRRAEAYRQVVEDDDE